MSVIVISNFIVVFFCPIYESLSYINITYKPTYMILQLRVSTNIILAHCNSAFIYKINTFKMNRFPWQPIMDILSSIHNVTGIDSFITHPWCKSAGQTTESHSQKCVFLDRCFIITQTMTSKITIILSSKNIRMVFNSWCCNKPVYNHCCFGDEKLIIRIK